MNEVNFFELEETRCEIESKIQLEKEFAFFYEILEFYSKILKKYSKHCDLLDEQAPIAVLLLNFKIIKTQHCLCSLLKKGHYSEFQALLRNVFEAIYLCSYFLKHPEKSESWIDGAEIKHRHVSDDLSIDENTKNLYGILCDYTHSNIRCIIPDLVFTKSPAIKIKSMPIFHKPSAYCLLIIQMGFTEQIIKIYIKFLQTYLRDIDTDDKKEFTRIQKKLKISQKRWRKYSTDPKNKMSS
jgi:hypothetical protein